MDLKETYDPTTGVIGFSVKVAGRRVPCCVTEDWLRDAYGARAVDEEGAMEAFDRRRAAIDATALKAWLASRGVEPVWLKRENVWRQRDAPAGESRHPEKQLG